MQKKWLWALGGAVVLAGGIALERKLTRHSESRVYVSCEESGTVTVIDGHTDKVVATIAVGKRPRGVQVSPDGKTVYVALSGSPNAGPNRKEEEDAKSDKTADGIGVIDTASNTLKGVIIGGSDPEQFAVSRDGTSLYIANEDTAEVSVIDIAKNAVVHAIPVGREPEGVTLSPDGKTVWVTSESDNKIYVIDTASNALTSTIDVGARPRSIALSADGSRAFVTLENAASLAIVDVAQHKVVSTVMFGGQNVRPMGIVLSPDGTTAYVTAGRGHLVFGVGTTDGRVQSRLEVGERPWGIGISRDGEKMYTANGTSNDVTVVDVPNNRILSKLNIGGRPWGIAVYPTK